MDRQGARCDVCGKPFTKDDDIVVCPECGTPHHRGCYRELGRCAHEDLHGSGYVWRPPVPSASPGAQETASRKTGKTAPPPDGDYVMCGRCGAINPASGEFCNLCRRPLAETGKRIPGGGRRVEGEDGPTTVAEYMKAQYDVDPEERLGDRLSAREAASYIGPNSLSFLFKFRAMAARNNPVSFNAGAFLFSAFYCFYRKMYRIGAAALGILILSYIPFFYHYFPVVRGLMDGGMTTVAQITAALNTGMLSNPQLQTASRIVNAVALALQIACGLFCNHFYLRQTEKAVAEERARAEIPPGSDAYYRALSRKGGTSFAAVLLAVLVLVGVSGLGAAVF